MKLGLTLLTIVLVGLVASVCGQTRKRARSIASSSHVATATGASASAAPASGRFKGDEDDDDGAGESKKTSTLDSDVDFDNDTKDGAGKGYYDGDDGIVWAYGHAASAADKKAMTTLVKDYYAAAAAADGAKGCALTYSTRANSLAEDFGPSYLPGAKTCAAVLTVVFRKLHSQAVPPPKVTGVRVEGDRADALLGSAAMPASVTEAQREHGVWKIDRVLSAPLP